MKSDNEELSNPKPVIWQCLCRSGFYNLTSKYLHGFQCFLLITRLLKKINPTFSGRVATSVSAKSLVEKAYCEAGIPTAHPPQSGVRHK